MGLRAVVTSNPSAAQGSGKALGRSAANSRQMATLSHGEDASAVTAEQAHASRPAGFAVDWNFANVPVFAKPCAVPIQPKLQIGAADDPLEREADEGGFAISRVSMPRIQTKLTVNRSGDSFEREADRVAEAVMRMSSPGPGSLQRKCACGGSDSDCGSCKKEREGAVQRAAAGSQTPVEAPPIVHNILRTPGRPLDPEARAFFEPRFGFDFGDVRVHTGEQAALSTRAIDSRAYTVGRHLVFGAREYAPHTPAGKWLLAHELTHVAQQLGRPALSAGIVRRAAPPKPTPLPAAVPAPGPGDFLITRVRDSTTSEIFFARNDDTLSHDAKTQIAAVKSAAPASVRLFGFSSADETATIAQSRVDGVKAALTAVPNPVTVTAATADPAAQAGQANFPSVRKVEIVLPGAAPSSVNCAAKDAAGNLLNPPKQPCSAMDPATDTKFKSALTIANDAMTRAAASVAGAPNAFDSAIIDQFFGNHNPGTLTTLKTNLGNLKTHVAGLAASTSCGGQCDSGGCDNGSTIAYNQGVDGASTMTVCVPVFKSLGDDNDRARNLIHESAHGTTPLGGPAAPTEGTKDVAYRHERMLFQLSTADRLRNSDSYALFALFLRERQISGDPAKVPTGIATPASDALTGFAAGELPAVKLAMAKLEKRLTWARDWMGQLYGEIVKIRAGSLTWATSWAEELMKEAAKRFPLSPPSAATPPTLTDQTHEAGILDRYVRMHAAVKRDLKPSHKAAGVVSWGVAAAASPIAADTVQIGPDFFKATPDDRISLLLESLAGVTKDVEAAFIPAYVSLAKWIHDQNP
jgi:hypothetical protein